MDNQISIDSLSLDGRGVGFLNGKICFVRDTLPGDIVELHIEKEKKNYIEASVEKLHQSSPSRIKSVCEYSKPCGGCPWIELEKKDQHSFKKKLVEDLAIKFQLIPKKDRDRFIDSYHESDSFHYRSRVTLRGRFQDGSLKVGFFSGGSHDLVEIDKCMVAKDAINKVIRFLSEYHENRAANKKVRFEIQSVPELSHKKVSILIIPASKPHLSCDQLKKGLLTLSEVLSVHVSTIDKPEPYKFEKIDDVYLYNTPGQFQQINCVLNEKLRLRVYKLIEESTVEEVWDLYGGSGNLSLHLKDSVKKVTVVETSAHARRSFKQSQNEYALSQYKYIRDDVLSFLKAVRSCSNELCIVLDPPRSGALEEVEFIAKTIQPQMLIYVSCNPNTLMRDLKAMTEKHYQVDSFELFDFFPNTHHIESLVVLSPKKMT